MRKGPVICAFNCYVAFAAMHLCVLYLCRFFDLVVISSRVCWIVRFFCVFCCHRQHYNLTIFARLDISCSLFYHKRPLAQPNLTFIPHLKTCFRYRKRGMRKTE
ncbi:hypothetical protein BDW60DRAFT_181427 [Aspergillus nidulans var. acristatus]